MEDNGGVLQAGSMEQSRWRLVTARPDASPHAIDGSARVVLFRGRLVNRSRLCRRYALPTSTPQAGVAAALYSRIGLVETARAMRGSASLIVWDGDRGRLGLAADRLGLNPLYYAGLDGQLLIASELEAILEQLPRAEPSFQAMTSHLAGLARPAGVTFFKRISQVEPGTVRVWGGGKARSRLFWSPGEVEGLKLSHDSEYEEHLRSVLSTVQKDWLGPLEGDVAATLSSGIDSGVVVAVTRQLYPSRGIDGFSWVSPGVPQSDESSGIEEIGSRLRVRPTPIEVDRLWTMVHPQGIRNPVAGPYAHPFAEAWEETFRQVAARGHRALFTGAGGDELFGGLPSYPEMLLSFRLVSLARQLSEDPSLRPLSWRGPRYLVRGTLGPILNTVGPWRRRRLAPPDWLSLRTRARARELAPPAIPLRGGQLIRRLRLRGLEDLPRTSQIFKVQSLAHTFGIELIHPLFDHRLVELAAALPADQTYRAGRDKSILRRAYRVSLNQETVQRPGKVTPKAIFDKGFRDKETAKVQALLRNMRCSDLGLVDEDRARSTYASYVEGKSSGANLWNLVTLESWLRDVI